MLLFLVNPPPPPRLYFLHLDCRVIYCSSDNILSFASFELKICSLCGCRMQAMIVCCNAKCSMQVAQKAETWASCFTSTTVKIRHNKHGYNELWGCNEVTLRCPSLISVCEEYCLLITNIAYNEGITVVNVNLLWRSLTVLLSSVLVHCAVLEWTAPVTDGCSHVGAHCHCANCIFLILICQQEQCAMLFFLKIDGVLVAPMSPLATACVEPTFVRCCWWPHNTSFMKVFVQNRAAPTICLHLLMLAHSQMNARVIVPHLSLTCCDRSWRQ